MIPLCLSLFLFQEPSADYACSWPIGFTVVQTDEPPKGDWITYWTENAIFEVTGDGKELEVVFDANDGYVGLTVHLWLQPDGARVTASKGDCTYLWTGDHVAGTSALVTDGTAVVLQFELYEGGGDFPECLHGQVELPPIALELVRQFKEPPANAPQQFVRHEFTPQQMLWRTGPSVTYVSSGYVDALGRRQGLWTLRERGSSTWLVEQSWKDGLPHGIHRELRGGVEKFGLYEQGFQEGEWWTGYPNGTRHVSEYLHDALVRTTNYSATGEVASRHVSPSYPHTIAYWRRIQASHTREAPH
ncbi:MAG: hypothetical protein ABL998_12080 [Planctomycetota bacterium]